MSFIYILETSAFQAFCGKVPVFKIFSSLRTDIFVKYNTNELLQK